MLLSARGRAESPARFSEDEKPIGPTDQEKTLLNGAQVDFDASPTTSAPWREVDARLRRR